MATMFSTQARRSFQVLWNGLDQVLLPHVEHGVVLAVSGGPDSRALMESVAPWQHRLRGKIVVAIIDHGVRKEAQAESAFIAMRAQRLGFIAHVERLMQWGAAPDEQDLRIMRYRALKKIAEAHQCRAIVLAHHADDDAEGFLMALMGHGGGELGAAMDDVANLDGLVLVRPFLGLHKQDLLLALSLHGFTDFVVDSMDEARIGVRAYVRHEIIPELEVLSPGLTKRLSTFGRHQRDQKRALERFAQSLVRWDNDEAIINLNPRPERSALIVALRQIMKRLSNGRDLRSCQPTVSTIAEEICKKDPRGSDDEPGLDPTLNGFNLKDLSVKQYQLPGVLVIKRAQDLVVKRV